MAKPLVNVPHHSNCNCCGRQASFKELGRRPSGYGALQSSPTQKRPHTHYASTRPRPLERKTSERIGSANQRRRSLQHGSESTQETVAQNAFDVLTGENHKALEIATEIAEAVAERSMLQAFESRLKGTSRDKESLLEECLALKDALADQLYHLQLHKVHHESADVEQRKMEITIQELETVHGLVAPRTGHPSQLRARILGLKCRQQEYYTILTTLSDDLEELKKDPRCSFTKEAIIERDVFALEIRRLQKIIRRLRAIYNKICTENNEVVRLRENISMLIYKIKSSQTSINNTKSTIAQLKNDIDKAKADILQAQKDTRNAKTKIGELESHLKVLQNMLAREKEEGIRIQRQTSAVSEQIRIVRKDNADRAVQAAISAGMASSDGSKSDRKSTKKSKKKAKLKEFDEASNSSTATATATFTNATSTPQSLPSTPKVPINNEFDVIRANYLNSIGKATNVFVESAPGSGSPRAKPHPDLGSPTGNHSEYEHLQDKFQKDVTDAENSFIDMMEKLEYGAARPRKSSEGEAKRLREELEALRKSQLDVKKWLENLTIELDDKTLKSNEYIIDVQDSKTSLRITSPDKSPEALARKKAEEEARRKREAEEAARRMAEDEARKKKDAEEAARRAAEDEARTKRNAEDEARRAAEDEARRKRNAEDEARRKAEEEAWKKRDAEVEARRKAEEEARKKRDAEVEARRKAEEEARKKRDAEVEARRKAEEEARKKRDAEVEARRKAEEEARKKRDAEDEARKKRNAEDEAKRKAEEEAKRKAEEEARKKRDAEDEARRKKDADDASKRGGDAAEASKAKDKQPEFFNEEMQGTIKENIKEVLGHLEVISKTVQQKATVSGTAESSAKEVLDKLEKPDEPK